MSAQNGTTLEGMVGGLPGVRQFGLNTNMAVDFSGAPSVALPGGTTIAGASNITSTSATALTVAASGTSYGLQVDESTSSAATGLKIKPAAAAAGLALSVISSGTNENLTIDAKGSGTIAIGGNSTGAISIYGFQFNYASGYFNAITSTNASALSIGSNGFTNPVLNIDASVASQATGLNIQGKAAGSNVALSVISSGTNEGLTLTSKGTGTLLFKPGSNVSTAFQVTKADGTTVLLNVDSSAGRIGIGNAASSAVLDITGNLNVGSNLSTALTVGPNGQTTPVLTVDASTGSQVAGLKITGAVTGGTVAVATLDSGADASLSVAAKGAGTITFNPAVTATAGGASNDGIKFGSLGVGLFTGTGSPSFSAMNGSIYVDSAATSTTTRIYVNKSGAGTAGTTWTNLTTAA